MIEYIKRLISSKRFKWENWFETGKVWWRRFRICPGVSRLRPQVPIFFCRKSPAFESFVEKHGTFPWDEVRAFLRALRGEKCLDEGGGSANKIYLLELSMLPHLNAFGFHLVHIWVILGGHLGFTFGSRLGHGSLAKLVRQIGPVRRKWKSMNFQTAGGFQSFSEVRFPQR